MKSMSCWLAAIALLCAGNTNAVLPSQNALVSRMRVLADSTRVLADRQAATRAELTMMDARDLFRQGSTSDTTSARRWWVFRLEKPTDQVEKLYSLPDAPRSHTWGASIVAEYGELSIICKPTGIPGLFAVLEFRDLPLFLGSGSEVRFDKSQWITFYGAQYRKGGFKIVKDGVQFIDGTETQVGDSLFVLDCTAWKRSGVIRPDAAK